MLFGKCGKDEIRVRHRQKPKLRLAALGNAFAPRAARAHGDLRLDQLISGALRIAFGIEETDDARFLIRLQRWRNRSGITTSATTAMAAQYFQRSPARKTPTAESEGKSAPSQDPALSRSAPWAARSCPPASADRAISSTSVVISVRYRATSRTITILANSETCRWMPRRQRDPARGPESRACRRRATADQQHDRGDVQRDKPAASASDNRASRRDPHQQKPAAI